MHIGLCYDLRKDYLALGYSEEETAEFDPPETIDGIDAAIQSHGHITHRIGNARALMSRLLQGERWDLVFNICEGMHGYGRESLVPALLDEYRIPYTFSDPLTLAATLHKGMAKTIVDAARVRTAPFAVINDLRQLESLALEYPLFIKPVAEGSGKGVDSASRADTPQAVAEKVRSVLAEFRQPALVESYLPGMDLTVSIIGTGEQARVIDVSCITLTASSDGAPFFTYANKENVHYSLASAPEPAYSLAAAEALRAWQVLECRDAGRVDMRLDADGLPHFLEVNPLPEINPDYSEITSACRRKGISYNAMIGMILESAIERLNGGYR